MSDKDFAPLTAACVRALNDKLYEKRKSAALEIERFVKSCSMIRASSDFISLWFDYVGVWQCAAHCFHNTYNK